MGKTLRIFLSGIANSLNSDGYNNIVAPSNRLGEIASRINSTRRKNHNRINKVVNGKISEATAK
ncbi:MAG: hypothetical protein WCY75_06675 [Sulfurimonadaceae bacterium]|jgi:hypothetical protein